MSAWAWVALAGWAVALCALRPIRFYRAGNTMLHKAVNGLAALYTDTKNERDTWRQQAIDDRATADALREELQRMRSEKQ